MSLASPARTGRFRKQPLEDLSRGPAGAPTAPRAWEGHGGHCVPAGHLPVEEQHPAVVADVSVHHGPAGRGDAGVCHDASLGPSREPEGCSAPSQITGEHKRGLPRGSPEMGSPGRPAQGCPRLRGPSSGHMCVSLCSRPAAVSPLCPLLASCTAPAPCPFSPGALTLPSPAAGQICSAQGRHRAPCPLPSHPTPSSSAPDRPRWKGQAAEAGPG